MSGRLAVDEVTLRLASFADAELLLAWRNEISTRQASKNTKEIGPHEHLNWLKELLGDPARLLYIGEIGGAPVGTVRADLQDDQWELSWTVAIDARGQGIAKKIVSLVLEYLEGSVRAEIKISNLASIKIAEYIGMRIEEERIDTLVFVGDNDV